MYYTWSLNIIFLLSITSSITAEPADATTLSTWITPWLMSTPPKNTWYKTLQKKTKPMTLPIASPLFITLLFAQFQELKKQSNILDVEQWCNQPSLDPLVTYLTTPTEKITPNLSLAKNYQTYDVQHKLPKDYEAFIDCKFPYAEHVTLDAEKRIIFIGDLHGSMHSFAEQLNQLHTMNLIDENWKLKPNTYICFLGDIVDRGIYGVMCWCTIMLLFNHNPENIMITRGNHEESYLWINSRALHPSLPATQTRRFIEELSFTYPRDWSKIGMLFMYFTELLPHAIIITSGYNELLQIPTRILCCHGGINPEIDLKPFLHSGKRYLFLADKFHGFNWSDFTGLTNDPASQKIEFMHNYTWHQNCARGCGYIADIPDTLTYLAMNELSSIVRGHQDTNAWFKLIEQDCQHPIYWRDALESIRSNTLLNPHPFHLCHAKNNSHHSCFNIEGMITNNSTVPVYTISLAADPESERNFIIGRDFNSSYGFNKEPLLGVFSMITKPTLKEWYINAFEYDMDFRNILYDSDDENE